MNITVLLALLVALALLFMLSFRLSLFLARRAICTVVSTFRRYNAVEPITARTLDELGLGRRQFFTILRDYRPWALQTLVQANVIRTAIEGMFYLSEEQLKATPGIQCDG